MNNEGRHDTMPPDVLEDAAQLDPRDLLEKLKPLTRIMDHLKEAGALSIRASALLKRRDDVQRAEDEIATREAGVRQAHERHAAEVADLDAKLKARRQAAAEEEHRLKQTLERRQADVSATEERLHAAKAELATVEAKIDGVLASLPKRGAR